MGDYYKYFNFFAQIAFIIVVSLLVFLFLGVYLDKKFYNGYGLFTILGIVVGLFSGGYNAYKIVKKYIKELEEEDKEKKKKII